MSENMSSGLVIKKSNIRIWIHQRDLAHLQQVIWEGHGSKLLVEHSNNAKVRKFLEALPHLMGLIKDVHCDVLNDDLEALKGHVAPPVPTAVLTAKDSNGLTPLHKAAGLGREDIARCIVEKCPTAVNAVDNNGRTPLHYAALLKDEGKMSEFLIQSGADESALDNKQKTAAYYKTRATEIDPKVLQVIPECPRTAKESFLKSFDWSLLTSCTPTEELVKLVKKTENFFGNTTYREQSKSMEKLRTEIEEDVTDNSKTNGHDHVNDNAEFEENNNRKSRQRSRSPEKERKDSPRKQPSREASPRKDTNKERSDSPLKQNGQDENNKESPRNKLSPTKERNSPTKQPSQDEERSRSVSPQKQASQEERSRSVSPQKQASQEERSRSVSPIKQNSYDKVNESSPPRSPIKPPSPRKQNSQDKADYEREEHNKSPTKIHHGIDENEKQLIEQIGRNSISPNKTNERSSMSPIKMTSRNSRTARIQSQDGSTPMVPQNSLQEQDHQFVDQEGVIEGIVNGENEIETLNEQGQEAEGSEGKPDDNDVASMVESGNMEQLAAIVLNGEGDRLVGQNSNNPELQSFLDNVPVYMTKINRIHVAARDGSLRDLQAALDRRKFAIAKDKISPNGASPLHVATIFGNTSIVRYLAGRFPETVQAIDDDGRTPLHYAAALADNGHYYNLLLHLGADTRALDKFGRTPEYYRSNQNELSHRKLLQDFGAEPSKVEEMLSDKVPDDTSSARKDLDDEDMIKVLERCFNVLHGRRSSNVSATSNASSLPAAHPQSSVLSKHMKKYTYDAVKSRVTKLDHNLYDLIWPSVKKLPTDATFRNALEQDFPTGIVMPDYYAYDVFYELLDPVIKDMHCIDLHVDLHPHPESKFLMNGDEDGENAGDKKIFEVDIDVDPHAKSVISGTLDCTRNLSDFDLPKTLSVGHLEEVERILTNALLSKEAAKAIYPNATDEEINEKGGGMYYTMNEVLEDPSEARVLLASNGLLIPLWNIAESDRLHGRHWPYGRGVFISNTANLAAWINVLDHLRIVTCTNPQKPGHIGQCYLRMARLVNFLQENLKFKFHEKYGHLSARPTALGNTLQFNLTVRFPYLVKDPGNLQHLCTVRGLNYHRSTQTTDIVRIGNMQCLGVRELQTLEDFATAVGNILQLEKDLAMSNSMHIAAMFVNIFRKRKALIEA